MENMATGMAWMMRSPSVDRLDQVVAVLGTWGPRTWCLPPYPSLPSAPFQALHMLSAQTDKQDNSIWRSKVKISKYIKNINTTQLNIINSEL